MARLLDPANYEAKSSYSFTVVASQGSGPSTAQAVTLSVANVNEAPVTQSPTVSVAEDATIEGTLPVVDEDVGDTYSFVQTTNVAGLTIRTDGTWSFDGANAAYQSLAAGASQLIVAGYTVTDAGGLTDTGVLTILVTGTNDVPTAVQVSGTSVAEYAAAGTVVGALSAIDPDAGDTATYLLLDSAGGRFAIVDGKLVVADGVLLDYEQAASHQVTVRVTDAAGATHDQVLTIAVTDVSPEDVFGSAGADTLVGGAGDDLFRGLLGKDVLDGGDGVDTASYREKTGAVVVTLNGSTFVTVFVNGVAEDTIRNIEQVYGGVGDDSLAGDAQDNLLDGSGGDDLLRGGGGRDTLEGGNGVDTADYTDKSGALTINLKGGTFTNVLVDGVVEDRIRQIENVWGGSGDDHLTGDAAANELRGGDGNDSLDGGFGNDTMVGGAGNDIYVVRDAGDVVIELAAGGNDIVRTTIDYVLGDNLENLVLLGTAQVGTGNALDNSITGGTRADQLSGLLGDDYLNGGVGDDVLDGGEGADLLFGAAGKDRLVGGAGSDRLTGGTGIDRLAGGDGLDRFVFAEGDTGATRGTADRIEDFNHEQRDRILLSAIDANTAVGGDQAFTFVGTTAFSGVAGELRYVVLQANTFVQGDTNGDRVSDLMIQLDGVHALVASDFVL